MHVFPLRKDCSFIGGFSCIYYAVVLTIHNSNDYHWHFFVDLNEKNTHLFCTHFHIFEQQHSKSMVAGLCTFTKTVMRMSTAADSALVLRRAFNSIHYEAPVCSVWGKGWSLTVSTARLLVILLRNKQNWALISVQRTVRN